MKEKHILPHLHLLHACPSIIHISRTPALKVTQRQSPDPTTPSLTGHSNAIICILIAMYACSDHTAGIGHAQFAYSSKYKIFSRQAWQVKSSLKHVRNSKNSDQPAHPRSLLIFFPVRINNKNCLSNLKILISLIECTGWSEASLFSQTVRASVSWRDLCVFFFHQFIKMGNILKYNAKCCNMLLFLLQVIN